MARLVISMQGSGIRSLADAMAAIREAKAKRAYARGINRVGAGAITHTSRALAKQTGLKVGVTRKALSNPIRATPARLEFFKGVRGGDIALKHFGARETLKGASAAPFAKRRIFASHFIKGGLFPERVGLKMNAHVMEPDTGSSRWGRPFEKARSGVVIPEQMLIGPSKAAFEAQAERLAPRIEHEIRVITKGVVS